MRISAFVAAFLLACGPVRGQDGNYGVNHAELHGWYDTLRNQQTGLSCCHSADCRPTTARQAGDKWFARIDGAWREVPSAAVLPHTAPDGQAHICTNPSGSQLYCFIKPALGM